MSKAQLAALRHTALAVSSNRTVRNDPGYLHRQIRRTAEMIAELTNILEQDFVSNLTDKDQVPYRQELDEIKSKENLDGRDTGRLDDDIFDPD